MYEFARAHRHFPGARTVSAIALALTLSACGAAPGEKALAGADAVKEAQEANAARLERIEKKLDALAGGGETGGGEPAADPHGEKPADAQGGEKKAEPAHAHWGYEGEDGPAKWAELSSEYGACAEGHAQSPVDIETKSAAKAELKQVEMDYPAGEAEATNNGHTIQVSGPKGDQVDTDGTKYTLAQFHFHTHSEHEIDGTMFPAEWHFVHKSSEGKLLVIGVLVKAGKENSAFDAVLKHLPKTKDETTKVGEINVLDMLPAGRMAYRYDGSLTTPPCTEGVKWAVLEEPIEMSKAQIGELEHLFGDNNRPVQPLGDRAVVEDDLKK